MNIIRWFDRHIEELLLTILSTIMVAVIFVQVVMRQLDSSLSWSEELARFCFIWLIYIGISYGVKKQRHIKVDVILVFLNQKGKVIINIIANVLFMAFAVFVIIYGFEIANKLLGFGQKSPALQIPMGLVYMSAPIGMGLTLIRLIQNLIKHLRVLQGKEEFEEQTII
ncbi:TRAP transporter small permease [Sporosarcina sp. E16_8]|uniref:TRAP transporter small permease n=1 Tax=Sporosarcina sp. E16_8 TaxID=2789295 RepID=UPI001A91DC2B|nr:TRAP transporter small permease [Sporosarcina sp. E16_8]MBO0588559.1 TRAP transporter small permease [Sporosarcina sp. E16_8]